MYISYQMIVLTTLLLSQEWANVHMLKAQPPMHHQLVWYIIIAVRLLSNDGHNDVVWKWLCIRFIQRLNKMYSETEVECLIMKALVID